MAKRVVLAYSCGLDASMALPWIAGEWGVEVVAVAVDAVVVDAPEEFATDFVARALKANAKYEGKYPLISSQSGPVIVEHLVAAARLFVEHPGADRLYPR